MKHNNGTSLHFNRLHVQRNEAWKSNRGKTNGHRDVEQRFRMFFWFYLKIESKMIHGFFRQQTGEWRSELVRLFVYNHLWRQSGPLVFKLIVLALKSFNSVSSKERSDFTLCESTSTLWRCGNSSNHLSNYIFCYRWNQTPAGENLFCSSPQEVVGVAWLWLSKKQRRRSSQALCLRMSLKSWKKASKVWEHWESTSLSPFFSNFKRCLKTQLFREHPSLLSVCPQVQDEPEGLRPRSGQDQRLYETWT